MPEKKNKTTKRPMSLGQMFLVGLTVCSFLVFCLFYTIIPIAGLQLLPFLFFGNVCLIVGVCDDLGLYR